MLVSKAYMMYQKFLSENAQFKVNGFTDEKRSEIQKLIDSQMSHSSDEEKGPVDANLIQGTQILSVECISGVKNLRK